MSKRTPYWTLVLKRAAERKRKGLTPFTDEQKSRAGEWVTCACGKQDPRIPRFEGKYAPEDKTLYEAGLALNVAVEKDQVDRARAALARIERRATEILRRLGAGAEPQEKGGE